MLNIVLGIIFLNKPVTKLTSSVILIIGLVQSFLCSMVLGVVFLDLKIGSSPFIMLKDAIAAPIFQLNPNFIQAQFNLGLLLLLTNSLKLGWEQYEYRLKKESYIKNRPFLNYKYWDGSNLDNKKLLIYLLINQNLL